MSALLPAYNEAAIIEQSVLDPAAVLHELAADVRIIVTNDRSRDGTGRVLARLQRRRPDLRLRMVTHPPEPRI